MRIGRKGAVGRAFVIWLIIGIAILVLSFVIYGIVTGKLGGFINYLGDLIKFGR